MTHHNHNHDHVHNSDEPKVEQDWEASSKFGTASGGLAGAATGAVLGAAGGPVGAVVGGIAGAVTGAGSGAIADAAGTEANRTLEGHGHEGPIKRGLGMDMDHAGDSDGHHNHDTV
ncbi:MAG: hypothetical protein M3R24_06870 [Chloroflexota bacterium]|nr:hypothetical protein [Chloroflexota bacterium]